MAGVETGFIAESADPAICVAATEAAMALRRRKGQPFVGTGQSVQSCADWMPRVDKKVLSLR